MHHITINVMYLTPWLWKCAPIWPPTKSINWYQLVQNICAKLVLNRSKYSSSTDVLCTLHWLPIQERIQFKILTLTYKCLENKALKYLTDLIIVKKPRRENVRSDSNGKLQENPHIRRQTFALRSFNYAAPPLWNSLSNGICQAPLLDKFKSLLIYPLQAGI